VPEQLLMTFSIHIRLLYSAPSDSWF